MVLYILQLPFCYCNMTFSFAFAFRNCCLDRFPKFDILSALSIEVPENLFSSFKDSLTSGTASLVLIAVHLPR